MEILIFIIITYAICNILVFGSIFEWLRNFLSTLGTGGYSLYKLFTCMMCLPTWVGAILSYIFIVNGYEFISPLTSVGVDNIPLAVTIDGFFASGSVWLIHTLQEKLEK